MSAFRFTVIITLPFADSHRVATEFLAGSRQLLLEQATVLAFCHWSCFANALSLLLQVKSCYLIFQSLTDLNSNCCQSATIDQGCGRVSRSLYERSACETSIFDFETEGVDLSFVFWLIQSLHLN
jgi:hypothetical protein